MTFFGLTLFSAPSLIVIFLLLLLAYLWYSYSYAPYQLFRSKGIPGPAPKLLDGNYTEFMKAGGSVGSQKYFIEKYGPVCGFYIGTKPYIQISDVKMLREICIKRSSTFVNHELFLALSKDTSEKEDIRGLFQARDDHWQRSRHILTPTFSAHKMKMMENLIATSVKRLTGIVSKASETGQSVDVSNMYTRLSTEVILTSAFGRAKNIQDSKEDDKLVVSVKNIFDAQNDRSGVHGSFIIKYLTLFPWLTPIVSMMARRSSAAKGFDYVEATSLALVKQRRAEKDNAEKKDLLQLMLDVHKEDVSGQEKALTDEEILSHSFEFLLAGSETTSSALSFCTYLLAIHPDIQEKLADEIEEYFSQNPESSMYDAAQKIEYLDMTINETMRLYPVAVKTSREAPKDMDVEVNGVIIPRGSVIIVPIHYIHHNPEYWPEPEMFDPDRFSAESKKDRDPLCFIPFGLGSRTCIGMRFALLEAKMTLISILRKYRIVKAPDTEVPLQTYVGLTMTAKNGIYLRFEPR